MIASHATLKNEILSRKIARKIGLSANFYKFTHDVSSLSLSFSLLRDSDAPARVAPPIDFWFTGYVGRYQVPLSLPESGSSASDGPETHACTDISIFKCWRISEKRRELFGERYMMRYALQGTTLNLYMVEINKARVWD